MLAMIGTISLVLTSQPQPAFGDTKVKVTVQNLANDSQTSNPISVRIVMVNLATDETKVVSLNASEEKFIGNLTKGDWAIVITTKRNNKNEFVAGGVASVIFSHTLVAIFESGVDSAMNN